jgi:serine/threonine protein kinase
MGKIYLVEDTKLGREVILKLLPLDFSSDPDRMRRFTQEAKAASSLVLCFFYLIQSLIVLFGPKSRQSLPFSILQPVTHPQVFETKGSASGHFSNLTYGRVPNSQIVG